MNADTPVRGDDGYYHPASEDEILALVQLARKNGGKLRVRGSGHSVAGSILASGWDGPNTPADQIDVLLDRFTDVSFSPDPKNSGCILARCQAGAHLGEDPYNPTGPFPWKRSLDFLLQQHVEGDQQGFALDDLGGISHQTVSGFLATGSSGGSTTWSIDPDLVALRIIDGKGEIHAVNEDSVGADKDIFEAAGVHLGLLGVVSEVTLRARPTYDITGRQTTTSTDLDECPIDLFGDGRNGKPSLERFLRDTEYTRLMWWPQHGFRRVQIWQAKRVSPASEREPYVEITQGDALLGSLFYTLIGNLEDVSAVPPKLTNWYAHLKAFLEQELGRPLVGEELAKAETKALSELVSRLSGPMKDVLVRAPESFEEEEQARLGAAIEALRTQVQGAIAPTDASFEDHRDWLADVLTKLVQAVIDGALETKAAQAVADVVALLMPRAIAGILGLFVTDGIQEFRDHWLYGLPMDNQMDDQLWPTWFTELWVPIEKAAAVMATLRDHYEAKDYDGPFKVGEEYRRTGAFSCEVYAAKRSRFWLSPSYGADVVRIDVFWFALNAASPMTFYPEFWELLAPFDFRPHWGKFLPEPAPDGRWRAYYERQLPRFKDFLAVRAAMDPDQIFVNDYWKAHFQL